MKPPQVHTAPPFDNDDRLARQARHDPHAFTTLYQRYFLRVYRYHIMHTGSVPDAQDLTSQTFVAALEGINSFRGTGSFAAWLMGIARNKKAMFFRSKRPEISLEAILELPDPGAQVENNAARRLQADLIHRALCSLSPERAEAVILCLFGGLTSAEAGSVMGKSEAAVKMLVFRGLRDLHTDLMPMLEETE